MRKCRPTKWLPWALLGVGFPLLCAALISDKQFKADVTGAAKQSLAGADLTKWADLSLDGRVAKITGKTTNAAAPEEVVKLVAATPGIRRVINDATVEPITLVAPTIESLTSTTPVSEIKGTWPETVAKSLAVTVDGTAYQLPGSPDLSSSNGNWLLKLAAPLAEGSHEVTASASLDSDGATITQAAQAPAKIVVDLPDPAPAPAVAAIASGATWPYAITGTFPEADVSRFAAAVAGREYVLGQGPDLTSDGKGTFTFAPSQAFAPGSYDVVFSQTDKAGNTTSVTAEKAIVVAAAEPAPDATQVPAPEPVADTAAPAAPVIALNNSGVTEARSVLGTWPQGDATSLSATFEGKTYVLGQNPELTLADNAPGTFLFAPDTASLAPGKYAVEFAAADAAGNVAKAQAADAIIIPAATAASEPTQAETTQPEPAAPAPAALAAPTVTAMLDLTGAPIIRGTWPEGEGSSLSINLAGKTYELGTSANLAKDGPGKWKLLPSTALKDGIYDVVATARNGTAEARDKTLAEVEVDATLPAVPVVTAHASDTAPAAVTGTFDPKRTASLKVAVPELKLSAELGATGSPLTADGETWSLALPQPVPPGTYNVVVTSTDKRGRSVEDAGAGEIVISAPHEAAPKSDGPFDCLAVMNRISSVFPMRFIYNTVDFQERFGLSVSQYAALLKDQRCATLKVEVGGHADERGADQYNEDLAERRAARVRDMLVEAGVAADRLSVASYGESQPLNAGHDEESWSVNRRVEIKIVK